MADLPMVMVGMSGGVDSSVSALLLKRQGYRVAGLFMKNWDEDDGTEYCTAKRDLADAQAVCDHLDIELHTANFAVEYWEAVFEHFLSEYAAGRTPNPDILCNREIKFKVFLEYAQRLGAELIATGHYARTRTRTGATGVELLKGCDANKDQTYFLHAVGSDEFAMTLFPVGELPKPEVRRLASEAGLATQAKRDSTGICFIGERRFKDFLQRYLPAQPGLIEDHDGNTLGEHMGLMYHTIGQRQGLGIGGRRGGGGEPWYVAGKDLHRNVLIVVQGDQHPALFSSSLTTGRCNFIGAPPPNEFRATAKVRYRQSDQACQVQWQAEGATVHFDQPQRAVTPGQSVVFYSGERCLGGAVIEARAP